MAATHDNAEKERRKFKRFDAYMSVKCNRAQESQSVSLLGLSKDVSRDGVCINSNDQLEKGTVVDLEIDLPDDSRPVRTTGKVMWTKASQNKDDGINYGVQFVSIDPIDKFRVLDYAYNHWLETKVNDFSDPEDLADLN